jgi:hypothetical protein
MVTTLFFSLKWPKTRGPKQSPKKKFDGKRGFYDVSTTVKLYARTPLPTVNTENKNSSKMHVYLFIWRAKILPHEALVKVKSQAQIVLKLPWGYL